ncbi:FtsW/RodA/SpoVE family cell cycle protein [Clostridium sp.]|uniref:FtsW/RodA/SpoVE family cell cycle protein n=1 Tax=Clostridium sp. TaxID=1506 RepID=UPI003F3A2894
MSSIDYSKIDNYTNEVCSLIKNKKVHENIKLELTSHIEELYDSYIEEGLNSDDALSKAISQMGDSNIVGKSLNKVHKAAPDWLLLAMASFFIAFGLFTLNFLQKNIPYYSEYPIFTSRIIIYTLIGAIISFLLLKLDYRNIKKYSIHIYTVSIMILILSMFSGTYINGAPGYLTIGPLSINLFYLITFLLPISLAGIFDNLNWSIKKDLIKGISLAFFPCIFFVAGPSLSNMTIYILAIVPLMIVSGLRLKYVAISFGSLFAVFSLLIFPVPYRVKRIFGFINPNLDPDGAGWIYNKLSSLRQSAGLFGQGASFNNNVLPDAHGDFILSYINYSFGWITTLLLLILILSFIVRIGFVATNVKDNYGKLLVYAFCSLFATQFLISILTNFSLSPVFGISLPFISYGGTNIVMNIISITLVCNVYKYRNTPFAKVVKN